MACSAPTLCIRLQLCALCARVILCRVCVSSTVILRTCRLFATFSKGEIIKIPLRVSPINMFIMTLCHILQLNQCPFLSNLSVFLSST